MSKLIIVESPNKIESIKKYVGAGYDVKASVGHIVYLPSSGEQRFGVDMTTWTPNYKIDPKKVKVVTELKAAVKKADEVLIATDPDREGEAIGDNLVEFLKIGKKYKRIKFNEITQEAVMQSIENSTVIDDKLVNSQIARRILDRIIGYKLSSLMRTKISNSPTAPSAGRVQTIALKKVVEREREIEAFVPIEYSTIEAKINDEVSATFISGNYQDKKEWIKPEDVASIKKELKGALKVTKVSTSKRKDGKRTPFKQAVLYKRADSKLGMSASSVQRAAQRLYEGYGDGGLISYPRTDSTRMSDGFVKRTLAYLESRFGAEYVLKDFKGIPGKQDAHEAIRPTDPTLIPSAAKSKFNLSSAEAKVYELIYNNTMMSLMTVPQREILRYDLLEGEHEFKLSSSKVIFDGYLKLVGYQKSKELPVYKENEIISVQEYIHEDSQTKPPARYNDGSLIETLDSIGVGRPSTFATTVNILKTRMYVTVEGRALTATDFGKIVLDKLVEAFPKIITEEYTANMEKELDDIAGGEIDHKKLLQEFWNYFEQEIQTATQNISLTQLQSIPAGKDCPKCGTPLVVKINKRDKTRFFACPKFPECKHTENDPTQKRRFFKNWKK